ncbi:MAG: 4-phosphoerythronate dehydrogenase [Lentisphaerae bacterium]|nr:4-phosphoerythronate dehydrogenase [Lentisphaerota bacterium]
MKIICATNIPYALEAFGPQGDLLILPPKEITAARVRDTELLIIRSTLRVDRELLSGSRVRFVGTTTIGTDHLDLPYLERSGINWCAAPGSNANSVAEYVAVALLCLAQRHGFTLSGKTLGIVGVGNVGSKVLQKAQALGLRVLQNDPPRQALTGLPGRAWAGGQAAEKNPVFLPLAQVLAEADILSLHVPLTRTGSYPTWHLAEERFFERLKPGAIFLNTARGAVMDSDAFLACRAAGKVAYAIIDTWEGEPEFRTDVLAKADIATPHIAGHSFEGKVMGTVMVYQAACRFLGVEPTWTPEGALPPPIVPEIRVDLPAGQSEEAVLWQIVRQVYDIEADDRRLRAVAGADAPTRSEPDAKTRGKPDAKTRGRHFEQLRRNYPIRREFRFTRVMLPAGNAPLENKVRKLGFAI